jgi:hypothetical protein
MEQFLPTLRTCLSAWMSFVVEASTGCVCLMTNMRIKEENKMERKKMKGLRTPRILAAGFTAQVVLGLTVVNALPIVPPNLLVCDGKNCEDLERSACSDGGFQITLKNYLKASSQSSGSAEYVYEICSPPAGTCSGTLRPGESCLDNAYCQTKGQQSEPDAVCSRECVIDSFRGLSHFDVVFPNLGTSTCLTATTDVSGNCTAIDKNNDGIQPVVGNFVLGDSSCFEGTSSTSVAKCDGTTIEPGDCVEMTLRIAGETSGLGLGAAVAVDKEANTCTSTCLAGPSCEYCDDPPGNNHCLTRTIGFWGTHPWITNNYATDASPISVCGKAVDCDDSGVDSAVPACNAGSCDSVMEALGSVPGSELPSNQPYVSLVKQLAAAKLNLKATQVVAPVGGNICTDWTYSGKSIQQWIELCESSTMCNSSKSQISSSGCIEALDAFNNSEDTGFSQTPPPFDRPSIGDNGVIIGADGGQFTLAQGRTTPPGKLVIGKNVAGGVDCR